MGIVAALILLKQNIKQEYGFEGAVAACLLSLLFTLKNFGLWFATAAWMAGLVTVATVLAPTFELYDSLKLLAAGYVGQELAHLITKEKTFRHLPVQDSVLARAAPGAHLLPPPLVPRRPRAHARVLRQLDRCAQLRRQVQALQQG